MSAKQKHGLGRGLDALLTSSGEPTENTSEVDINTIDPNPDQPRLHFDEDKLSELSASIKEHGVLQPLLVVRQGERYMLVAGERRWRAARIAGLRNVPVIVRDYSPQQVAEISLVENLQRDDLNPVEEAMGIRSLIETFDLTQEQVAERLSMSRPAVTNSLRLLSLPISIQDWVLAGSLSAGHARAVAALEDENSQLTIARRAIDGGLSVREVEALARKTKLTKDLPSLLPPTRNPPEFKAFEEMLMKVLGTRVHVKGSLDKGSILIDYFNRQDLERIYALASKLSRDGVQ
jgi:ParB family transcriptional regulator, chromosome partitioning protein